MPQVTIRRPLGELDLRDQLRFEPHAVFHLFLTGVSSVRLGPQKNFGSHVFNDKKVTPAVDVGGGISRGTSQNMRDTVLTAYILFLPYGF